MALTKKITLALFSNMEDADEALDDLLAAGYNPREMSVITKETTTDGRRAKGGQTASATTRNSSLAEGALSGMTTGGIIGGIAGLLIGAGAITVPGIGALLIGGPLAAALGLTGVAATTVSGALTGVLAGGLVGSLVGLGVPEETARIYERGISNGGVLLAVPTERNARGVEEIMARHGADQIRAVSI